MKKVLAVLAGAAAIGGAAWFLYRKYGKRSVLVSDEFGEDETIVLNEADLNEAEADEK